MLVRYVGSVALFLILIQFFTGAMLAFIGSLGDVVVSYFVSGPGSTTLPLVIFSKVRLGLSPEINALATVIITVVSMGVFGAALYQYKRSKTIG